MLGGIYSPDRRVVYHLSNIGTLVGAISSGSAGLYVTIRTLSEPPIPEYYKELIDQMTYYPALAIIGVLGTLSFTLFGAVAGSFGGATIGVVGEELYDVGKGVLERSRRILKRV